VPNVVILAGRIMLERLDELAAQRADFAFETTLASRAFAPFVKRLSEDSYQVRLVTSGSTTLTCVWSESRSESALEDME